MASYSGKKLSAKIASTTVLAVVAWHVDDKVDELDGMTAADAGYDHPDAGARGATIKIKGICQITSGGFAFASLQPGATVATLKLFRDINDTTEAYNFASALVLNATYGAENRGRFEVDITLKSVGSFTYNDPS